jgi:hypothetical protein
MYAIRATYLPRDGMYFDSGYYLQVHMPLARRLLTGRVNFVKMHAEFDMRVLMDGNAVRSPCVFVLFVETEADVHAFRDFRSGPDVLPLKEDVPRYTNCTSEWTVARVMEG